MSGRLSTACARAAVPLRVTVLSSDSIMKALRGSMARMSSVNGFGCSSCSSLPRESVTRVMRIGLTR